MHHRDGGDRKGAGRVHFICDTALARVQHELFDLGAELACPPENLPEYMVLIGENQADTLVSDMDAWLTQVEPLTSFILPVGGPPQAVLHHARTVARRLERGIVSLREHEGEQSVRPLVLTYINRMSDWLFVLGRWITAVLGEDEMLWLPLGKRGQEEGIANSILRQAEHDADLDHI
jgi:cob(I)alamin adenosyltransferase